MRRPASSPSAEQAEGRAPYVTRYWQGTGGAWCMSQGEGEDAIYTIRERQEVSFGDLETLHYRAARGKRRSYFPGVRNL